MIPLHPKRHLVAPRNYSLEPEQHGVTHATNRGHTFGEKINPWILDQLRSTERFNVTPEERKSPW